MKRILYSRGRRSRAGQGKKRSRKKNTAVFFLLLAVCLVLMGIVLLNQRMMPAVLAVTDLQTKNKINRIMYESVSSTIEEMAISSQDFIRSTGSESEIQSFSINTVLVNEICSRTAMEVSGRLATLEREKVSLPAGALLGVDALANFGPLYTMTVIPMGSALVDYETSFEAVGINQVHFQVFLHMESTVQVVNPLQRREISVSRKISLVDTVIHGTVPNVYLGRHEERSLSIP